MPKRAAEEVREHFHLEVPPGGLSAGLPFCHGPGIALGLIRTGFCCFSRTAAVWALLLRQVRELPKRMLFGS